MNDGLEYVVYISPDGQLASIYSDDEEDAQFYGRLFVDGDELYDTVGTGVYVKRIKAGVML
jgi:hypothetical protein